MVEEIIDPNDTIKGLTPALTAKIRAKERLLKERQKNLQPTENITKHAKFERMYSLCDMLKAIYGSQKTPSCFFKCLVKKVKDTHKITEDRDLIEEDLNDVIKTFPD